MSDKLLAKNKLNLRYGTFRNLKYFQFLRLLTIEYPGSYFLLDFTRMYFILNCVGIEGRGRWREWWRMLHLAYMHHAGHLALVLNGGKGGVRPKQSARKCLFWQIFR